MKVLMGTFLGLGLLACVILLLVMPVVGIMASLIWVVFFICGKNAVKT